MMDGFGMGFGWIFWILLLIAGFFLVKYFTDQSRENRSAREEKSPIDILKERYARGEIDQVEFDERRKKLLSV